MLLQQYNIGKVRRSQDSSLSKSLMCNIQVGHTHTYYTCIHTSHTYTHHTHHTQTHITHRHVYIHHTQTHVHTAEISHTDRHTYTTHRHMYIYHTHHTQTHIHTSHTDTRTYITHRHTYIHHTQAYIHISHTYTNHTCIHTSHTFSGGSQFLAELFLGAIFLCSRESAEVGECNRRSPEAIFKNIRHQIQTYFLTSICQI